MRRESALREPNRRGRPLEERLKPHDFLWIVDEANVGRLRNTQSQIGGPQFFGISEVVRDGEMMRFP